MTKKVIIFGPWTGEFSYEISWWIPMIRQLRHNEYKGFHSVHVGYIGRKGLYKDFIDEYVSFPEDINNSIVPGGWAADENGYVLIPENTVEFTKKIICDYQSKDFEVSTYSSNQRFPYSSFQEIEKDICQHNPPGEFKHINPSDKINALVRQELAAFNNNRNIVAVMVRSRSHGGGVNNQDWNPKNWETFIDMLINKLDLNVVMIGVPQRGRYPGSLIFEGTEMYEKNKKYIKSFICEDDDAIEYQLALLKNTTCSIYGSTGAAAMAFFTNTPLFTMQCKENGWRLGLDWQKRLTGGHHKVRIFDEYSKYSENLKYPNGELFDAPVKKIFKAFKSFYVKKVINS